MSTVTGFFFDKIFSETESRFCKKLSKNGETEKYEISRFLNFCFMIPNAPNKVSFEKFFDKFANTGFFCQILD